MSGQTESLSQITQQAIEVLFKEIGIVSTVRFLNQFSVGYGNYMEERYAFFQDLTLEDILQQMQKYNQQ